MHQFQHGIWRSFLTAGVGSLSTCLPLLPFDGAEPQAVNIDLQQQPQEGQNDGDVRSTRGDVDESDNQVLQPPLQGGYDEEKTEFNLEKTLCEGQDYGSHLSTRDDKKDQRANIDLAVAADKFNLHDLCKRGDAESGSQPPIHSGVQAVFSLQLALINGQNQDDKEALLPLSREEDVFGVNMYLLWQSSHDLKDCLPPLQCGDALQGELLPTNVEAWLMTFPRPRVKMKGSMKLYDTHAWKHDAWVLPSSPFHLSINTNLADADHIHRKQAASQGYFLPFTPLRGRDRCQGREMQTTKKMLNRKMQTETKMQMIMMQLWLFYLTKDVLDPG